jgi:hypothetical protein
MAQIDRAKAVKLFGMLGSAYEGERANAAAALNKLRQAAGLSWDEMLRQMAPPIPTTPTYPGGSQSYRGGFRPPSPPPPPRPPRPERLPITPEGRAAVARLKDHLHKMEKKDQDFVWSVLYQIDKFGGVTQKQSVWIDRLFAQYPK